MEKGQSEVTNKIRSAIKQKLAEISDFVDDELPEYIMILVANQRSKSQIEKDLSLFLRKDTVNFTNWLWDLLNNLKVCPKTSHSSVSKVDSDILKKDTIDADEDAVVLDFDPDEHENDFLTPEDTNDSLVTKSIQPAAFQGSYISKSTVQPISFQVNEGKKEFSLIKSKQNSKLVEKNSIIISEPVNAPKKRRRQISREPLSSAVIPVKRKYTDIEDEYDPAKPQYEKASYSSNIRNYGGPAALQANKLLQKAVNDATKSILKGKSIEDFYKPTPIKVLTLEQPNKHHSRKDSISLKNTSVQELARLEPVLEEKDSVISQFDPDGYLPDIVMEDDVNDPVSSLKSRTICLKTIPFISGNSEFGNENFIPESNYNYSFETVEEVRPKSPHFIVTLDGVSRTTFKRKFEENSVDSLEEDDNNEVDEILPDETTASEQKLKMNERCKYWPACKNSDQCLYHHPTVPCKCFPECKFGDKCLYIHPNCKFDALCSRKDCPFTHASKRKLPFIAVPVKMVPVKSRRMKIVCKFYPKCTSKNCPFIHPKLCRYGTECRLPACLFGHFPVPSRSQMKWQATIS